MSSYVGHMTLCTGRTSTAWAVFGQHLVDSHGQTRPGLNHTGTIEWKLKHKYQENNDNGPFENFWSIIISPPCNKVMISRSMIRNYIIHDSWLPLDITNIDHKNSWLPLYTANIDHTNQDNGCLKGRHML